MALSARLLVVIHLTNVSTEQKNNVGSFVCLQIKENMNNFTPEALKHPDADEVRTINSVCDRTTKVN